jgi:RimJ/RimL family protein N-acetyltransferase
LAIATEGRFDERGHVRGLFGFTIASARDGQAFWMGSDLPDALARELAAVYESVPASHNPSEPPAALAACEPLLDKAGRKLRLDSGPYYRIEQDVRFSSSATVLRSDTANLENLREANPGNWHPVEWEELLEGRLGPWAMVTEGDRVISICHTPLPLTNRSAECGVWTHPEFRGHGHAAAVTSEWAAILRPTGRHLFYSHSGDNLSSLRVTQRLNLREIGWIWRLEAANEGAAPEFHPLSRLSRRGEG